MLPKKIFRAQHNPEDEESRNLIRFDPSYQLINPLINIKSQVPSFYEKNINRSET